MNKEYKYRLSYLLTISFVTALGGFLFGYDWVVIGGAKPFYERFFDIVNSPALQGWAMSCALVGCLVGSVISGSLSDRFGRKSLLLFSAILFTITGIGTGLVNSFSWFVFYRILGGIGIGLASNLSPMYIAEVSPASVRGKFVSLNQLTIVIGILAAQIVNWKIAQPVPLGATDAQILASWNGQMGWRFMFWAESVPAFLFFVFMIFVPESPRWLVKAKKLNTVLATLTKIGGEEYAKDELNNIQATLQNETEETNFKSLFQKKMARVMIIGIVLAVFQQWCGINVIFNYAEEIFKSAGYGVSDILFNIVITGSVNLIFTFLAIYTVDKLGRRALMLIGAGGLTGIFAILGTLYFLHIQGLPLLILVILAIACYAMSLAPITWVVLSEIFPNRVRGAAMAVATFALWTACFILTYSFPLLNKAFGAAGTFWVYGGISLAGFLFIRLQLPETKGKTLEELEQLLIKE